MAEIYKSITDLQAVTTYGFQKFGETTREFHSFMTASVAHAKELQNALETQFKNNMVHQGHLNVAINFLLQMFLQITEFSDSTGMLDALQSQLTQLINGHLSTTLIQRKLIREVINHIDDFLIEHNITFYNQHRTPDTVYRDADYTLTRNDTHLFLTLSFSLLLCEVPLTLYSLEALDMPTDDQNLHVSRVISLSKFLAYNPTCPWYFDFSEQPHLSYGIYEVHFSPASLRHKDVPSCSLALLELDRTQIQRLCKFAIIPFAAKINIYILTNRKLVLQYCNSLTHTR